MKEEKILYKYYIYLSESEMIVTNLVKEIIKKLHLSGMKIYLDGLDNRIKKFDSFICKCNRKDNLYPPIFYVYDVLRYSIILSKDFFYRDYQITINSFKKMGLEIYRIKNTWIKFDKDIPYRGINILFGYKNGLVFEIQVHTCDSYKMNLNTHDSYIELLACTDNKVIRKIKQELKVCVDNLQTPDDITCIVEYNNEKKMLNDILKYSINLQRL